MNLVLLAYHYPPDPAVGGLRAAKVARAFRDLGHQVTVVTARLPGEGTSLRIDEPGLQVLSIVPSRTLRQRYIDHKHRRGGRAETAAVRPESVPGARYAMPTRVPFWKRLVFSFMWLPDDRQGFVRPAVRAALPLLRQPDSVLYTTAPPFSSLLAGWHLHRKSGVPWVAEFRDPWTDNPWKPAHVRTGLTDALERSMERRVLNGADLVVAVSSGIERVLRPKLESRHDRLIVIRNGIDRILPGQRESRAPTSPLRIVHVGSFYYGRDPRPFLGGLAELRQRRRIGSGDLRVDLVGQGKWFAGVSVEQEVQRLGIADLVHFHDWMPHEKAQEFIHQADVLLLLAQNQPDQVPNKLYEYLGVRRPILAFVDAAGESASMLEQIGGHSLITGTDLPTIAEALDTLLEHPGEVISSEDTRLTAWTTEAQMQKLIQRIGAI